MLLVIFVLFLTAAAFFLFIVLVSDCQNPGSVHFFLIGGGQGVLRDHLHFLNHALDRVQH